MSWAILDSENLGDQISYLLGFNSAQIYCEVVRVHGMVFAGSSLPKLLFNNHTNAMQRTLMP